LQDYFIWNGVDSRTMGVIVTKLPPRVYPAERVEQTTVPGRPGFLTRTQGEGIYDGYLLSIGIANKRTADAAAIAAWLRGAGELIVGSEPDRVYYGRIIKEASLERVMRGAWSGTVAWMVQPGKGQVPTEGSITISERHYSLYNPGDLPARPIYRVTKGTDADIKLYLGPITKQSHLTVFISGTSWASETEVVIDSDTMQVTTADGSESLTRITRLYYNGAQGLWIPPHEAIDIDVTGAGQSQVIVTPRWRWL